MNILAACIVIPVNLLVSSLTIYDARLALRYTRDAGLPLLFCVFANIWIWYTGLRIIFFAGRH